MVIISRSGADGDWAEIELDGLQASLLSFHQPNTALCLTSFNEVGKR